MNKIVVNFLFPLEINIRTFDLGEPVSIAAQSLQAGHISLQHFLSLNIPVDNELVLASLMHDIGHMLGEQSYL